MSDPGEHRRLAAILAADVVGYSRLMGEDESGTLTALKSHRKEVIEPKVAAHEGRIVKLLGDGVLVEFPSALEAVRCAIEVQRTMAERNADVPESRQFQFRIGVNLGDVVSEGDDIYGDGINVAARLEALAKPGGICLSSMVHVQIQNKVDADFQDLGEKELKNIAYPVHVFSVLLDGEEIPIPERVRLRHKVTLGQLVGSAFVVVLLVAGGVALWLKPWEPNVEPVSLEKMAFPLPEKPSIAVMPFDNLSGDPEQEYFADGMTDDLITDLSRISGLFVIARNSSFSYKGQQVKVRQIAEELGVRYVLEGSVRRAGDQVRINAQLIDASTGGHLWAERYDRDYVDIFDLQNEVIGRIVSALAVQLTDTEKQQMERQPTDNLEAYEYYLKAEQGYYSYNFRMFSPAVGFYRQALELDPNFAEAHAGYARIAVDYLFSPYSDLFKAVGADEARRRAYESATRALALNPELSRAHAVLGLLHAMDGNYDEAIISGRRSVSLDPNNAKAYTDFALVLIYAGRASEAIAAMETALRLEPNPPHYYLFVWSQVLFMNRQYDQALDVLREVKQEQDRAYIGGIRLFLAMTLAELGRLEEAREVVNKDFLQRPFARWWNVTLFRHMWAHHKRKKDLEGLLDALRLAGFPEWPVGYQDPSWEQLDGPAIKDLLFGNDWIGQSLNKYEPFRLISNEYGRVRFYQFGRFWNGTATVEEDKLCYDVPALLANRKFCGPIYRNPSGKAEDRNEYVAIDIFDVHHFSLKE